MTTNSLDRISKEMPLYEWHFDGNQFSTNTEIVVGIRQIKPNTYQEVVVFYDGYEVEPEETATRIWRGSFAKVREQIITEFNQSTVFDGYPVIFRNVQVEEEP